MNAGRRRGRRGGKEEVRRLPTIGADVTSTERESSRMQLFDHQGWGRLSPPLLAQPPLHVFSSLSGKISQSSTFIDY